MKKACFRAFFEFLDDGAQKGRGQKKEGGHVIFRGNRALKILILREMTMMFIDAL